MTSDPMFEVLERTVLAPAVGRQMLAAIAQRLEQDPGNARFLRRAADLARGLGLLADAEDIYRRLAVLDPLDQVAPRWAAMLAGTELPPGPTMPFLRVVDLLGPDQLAELWSRLETAKGWEATGVYNAAEGDRVDREIRDSVSLPDIAAIEPLVLPAVLAAYQRMMASDRLGLAGPLDGPSGASLVSHLDGGRFRLHVDQGGESGGPMSRRQLTFVYYLHRTPKLYSGGELALFDTVQPDTPPSFTRLAPDNDSLVLFPAQQLHAVLPVRGTSADPLDGRLAFTGWFHSPPV